MSKPYYEKRDPKDKLPDLITYVTDKCKSLDMELQSYKKLLGFLTDLDRAKK